MRGNARKFQLLKYASYRLDVKTKSFAMINNDNFVSVLTPICLISPLGNILTQKLDVR